MILTILDGLTYCVYCVLAGWAAPEFPGTSRSGPALEVFVALTREGSRIQGAAFFPYRIRWDHWQFGVVPVLEDPVLAPGSLATQDLSESNSDLRVLIKSMLVASFIAAGFLPANFQELEVND